MTFLTDLTRMWLTRSARPFRFTDTGIGQPKFADCESPGLYVHIPFCRRICNFCPYCKTVYDEALCRQYVDALVQEIHLVCAGMTEKKPVTSLYFGGGTPALAQEHIGRIIRTLEEYFLITEGIGIELHPENVTVPTLTALREAGVTRISIGIQSFQPKFQRILGRPPVEPAALKRALEQVPFQTVSMDFIFALPEQTFPDLKADIETAFAGGANHIAVYPFIDFTFTESPVAAMNKRDKHRLLDEVTAYCAEKGLRRSSIWTFASSPEAEYSSMTRETFLGFGCSAATLLRDSFRINTFSVEDYCARVREKALPTSLTLQFTERQRMVYWLFWTAYGTRVDERDFERFFGVPLRKKYGAELQLAKLLGFVTEKNGVWQMTLRGAFYYHYYENFYTLAYIDKMWGVLRKEAFPQSLTL